MRAFTPEISWHNRLPALSMDISKIADEITGSSQYRIATGGNDCRVYIWLINIDGNDKRSLPPTNPVVQIRAGLRRHQKSVGAVRFSPTAHILASGDDDGYIYLWKHKEDAPPSSESNAFLNDDDFQDLELWQQQRVLRGHIEDICDLAWSKDGQFLLSGSVDNSAILWDTFKGTKIWCSDLMKGYVQGVAIDPQAQFMATLSSDRTLRIFNFSEKRQIYAARNMNIKDKYKACFCDDTVKTFCRRLEFSPDGQFLLAPTSRLIERKPAPPEREEQQEEQEQQLPPLQQPQESTKNYFQALLVFRRTSLNKPAHYYPTGEVALCVRFSPVVYQLRLSETNFWNIPYRIVFAVATTRNVIIYDSQQPTPIGYISQIHLARLTDLAWSNDGRMLMVSSYDGYSTIVTFEHGEFGEIYTGALMDAEPVKSEQQDEEPIIEVRPTKKQATTTRLPESATLWRFINKKHD